VQYTLDDPDEYRDEASLSSAPAMRHRERAGSHEQNQVFIVNRFG